MRKRAAGDRQPGRQTWTARKQARGKTKHASRQPGKKRQHRSHSDTNLYMFRVQQQDPKAMIWNIRNHPDFKQGWTDRELWVREFQAILAWACELVCGLEAHALNHRLRRGGRRNAGRRFRGQRVQHQEVGGTVSEVLPSRAALGKCCFSTSSSHRPLCQVSGPHMGSVFWPQAYALPTACTPHGSARRD